MKSLMRMFKRVNGYWYYEIRRNRPRSLNTKDKSEAKALFKAIRRRYLKGKVKELDGDQRTSLSEFVQVFLSRHTDVSDKTYEAYELALKLFMDSVGGSTLMSRAGLLIDKFKSDCIARGCQKSSVNTYLRHLNAVFTRAKKWGYIDKKPEVEFYRIGKRHPKILKKDEIELLLLHSQHCHPEMHRIIKFALWTGCRRAEIYNLQWQNVGENSCTVIGKGDKERTIPLLPGAIEALGPRKDIGYVFLRYHLDYYTKEFKKLVRDCEIEGVSFHKLRHTAATQMLASGISLESVQKLLGHTDISTTQIYAQVLQDKLQKEMQKFTY